MGVKLDTFVCECVSICVHVCLCGVCVIYMGDLCVMRGAAAPESSPFLTAAGWIGAKWGGVLHFLSAVRSHE